MRLSPFARALVLLSSSLPLFAQGPLAPPGTPAPTMQSLEQIGAKVDQHGTKLDQANSRLEQLDAKSEKRIDVQTLPGDNDFAFIITEPGSYYLSGNITGSKGGISIRASNVTLDLNGFTLQGNVPSGPGIGAQGDLVNVTVRNGTVRGWVVGVAHASATKSRYERLHITNNGFGGIVAGIDCGISDCVVADNVGAGISVPDGRCLITGCTVSGNAGRGITAGVPGATPIPNKTAVIRDCSVSGNGATGITTPFGSVITDSTALDNAGDGISTGAVSTVARCTAYRNRGTYGIVANDGSTIIECSANANTSSGSSSYGIFGHDDSTIVNCTAASNTNTNATASPSTGAGIGVDDGSTVTNCTASLNKGDGIELGSDSLAVGNTAHENGFATATGAGIHAVGSNNRIEGNNVTENDRGIEVDGAGNLIIKNSASDNTANYDFVANNVFGAIVDRTAVVSGVVNGNSAVASSAGTTDPWANFSY